MSDIITSLPDPAIEIIDEQVAALNADIAANTRRLELDTAVRDRLLAVRATLARKLRPRKVRAVNEIPASDMAEARKITELPYFEADSTSTLGVRPTVFASPTEEAA